MSGTFDVIITSGDVEELAGDFGCEWLRLDAVKWGTVCQLVELAQGHGLNVLLYPREVEAEEADGQT